MKQHTPIQADSLNTDIKLWCQNKVYIMEGTWDSKNMQVKSFDLVKTEKNSPRQVEKLLWSEYFYRINIFKIRIGMYVN